MRSSIRNSFNGQLAAETPTGRSSKEISLEDLLASKNRKSPAAMNSGTHGYSSSFTRSTNLGRSRPATAVPLAKISSEKKFSESTKKPAKKLLNRHSVFNELKSNSKKKSGETDVKVTRTISHQSRTPVKSTKTTIKPSSKRSATVMPSPKKSPAKSLIL